MPPLLEVEELQVFHGDLQAVFGVSLAVGAGEALALIGANGAGKSTLLRAITGLTPPRAGRIRFDGEDLAGLAAEAIAPRGIALVPEGRQLFASLTVEENLQMGALVRRPGGWNLNSVYALFPMLRQMRARPATALSGGQQQMVAIGRALMGNPRLLLCDELSLGLAPAVTQEIYAAFARIRAEGLAIVLVEQDVARACAATDRLVCLLKGRVTLAGASDAFDHARIAAAYFGEK
jgi:branched-chain amino acid transport system ATP-binding protein